MSRSSYNDDGMGDQKTREPVPCAPAIDDWELVSVETDRKEDSDTKHDEKAKYAPVSTVASVSTVGPVPPVRVVSRVPDLYNDVIRWVMKEGNHLILAPLNPQVVDVDPNYTDSLTGLFRCLFNGAMLKGSCPYDSNLRYCLRLVIACIVVRLAEIVGATLFGGLIRDCIAGLSFNDVDLYWYELDEYDSFWRDISRTDVRQPRARNNFLINSLEQILGLNRNSISVERGCTRRRERKYVYGAKATLVINMFPWEGDLPFRIDFDNIYGARAFAHGSEEVVWLPSTVGSALEIRTTDDGRKVIDYREVRLFGIGPGALPVAEVYQLPPLDVLIDLLKKRKDIPWFVSRGSFRLDKACARLYLANIKERLDKAACRWNFGEHGTIGDLNYVWDGSRSAWDQLWCHVSSNA